MDKISPCIWFDNQAEEAAKFYTSVFKDGKIDQITHYGEAGPGEQGSVMTVVFHLHGQEFMALNGGPEYKLTPALSLMIYCQDQAEVDYFWERLSEGGEKSVCGWLTDKYGLSWQVVPSLLIELQSSKDSRKKENMMRAMLQMTKLDISELKAAYERG